MQRAMAPSVSARAGHLLGWTLVYVVVVAFILAMIGPMLWMLSTALKPTEEVLVFPPTLIPEHPTLANFPAALATAPFGRFFLNSGVVAVSVTASVLFFCSLTGYTFAKFRFWGRNFLFVAILSTMMIPFEVRMVPLYLLVRTFGWLDSYLGLIVPGMMTALGVFLMRQFMLGIPDDLLDAARIDGCSELGIYWTITLPLCQPPLAALTIFTFMGSWDSFVWPLVVIDTTPMRTLPLGLALFNKEHGVFDYNLLMAATLVVILPVVIVFVALQRYFIQGITLTGLKA